ncbi:S-methylmethionine--homocysteine S-methyltransferase BHMT2 [Strongylocentrotus purpuratus]|uniref:Hcy-binding domain-containing protein n=1 Tax=Strongylocentrotus purpuratus TaxID=7668 RepID=A0A7M7SZG4_STRPU|nr:S-methylmethionine--homocysteine S-methyltransferase BHMT2 [Strongylocentrotus purpuratus]
MSSSLSSSSTKGLLERLADGPVVGDGSMLITLEKRGYVMAGSWTPEATLQYPDAVKQLHREFLRAGADVIQTFTYCATEDNLKMKNEHEKNSNDMKSVSEINHRACDLAREVANEGGALVAGSVSNVNAYRKDGACHGAGKEFVQNEFKKQCDIFVKKGVDFLLGEFFAFVEEAEWAVEVMAETGLPVACTMRISVIGDQVGVAPGDVAVRMAKAGADVIGVNCCYDPDTALKTLAMMKEGLEKAGLQRYLMAQPLGYHAQEITDDPRGYSVLPEFPFAMESRALTRTDVREFARRAYDEVGVRYIGGCCGFEPYHIRAIAEELTEERGRSFPGRDKSDGYSSLKRAFRVRQHKRANPEYWKNLVPAAGREKVRKLAEIVD